CGSLMLPWTAELCLDRLRPGGVYKGGGGGTTQQGGSGMSRALRDLLGRWRGAAYGQHQLDALLHSIDRAVALEQKKAWLVELFAWIRGSVSLLDTDDADRARKRTVRVRFLLQVLERSPENRASVLALVAAVL